MKRNPTSGRTPLFRTVRRAIAVALHSRKDGSPPVDEWVGLRRENALSRRDFLKLTALGSLAAGSTGLLTSCANFITSATAPRIVIVGGGMAGLNAACQLKGQGLRTRIYDANKRSGGRMFTGHDLMGPGLSTELGGEFIDSNHEDILALARHFQLPLYDVAGASEQSLKAEAYFFEGRHFTEEQLVEAFRPVAARMKADVDLLGEIINHENAGGGKALDNTSLAQYLDNIGATGWLRRLLEVAYVTEYGLDAAEQSSLNLLWLISTDLQDGVKLLGESDERYKIQGGNQRLVDAMAREVGDQLHLEHRLLKIKARNAGYTLCFSSPNGATLDVDADIVIMALPFSLLREVEMELELPAVKQKAIRELGYGNCSKVMAGFDRRLWREQGYGGNVYSDEPFQLGWDNTRMQPGEVGGITFYTGGAQAVAAGDGTAEAQVRRLLPGLNKVFPGVEALHNDRASRFHWPSYPWSKGAYAAYRVGQWTTIGGAEIQPVGNLLFAGEHCSSNYQGFMNGAAETGRIAAETLIARLKR